MALSYNDLTEIQTLLHIAAYDWKKEFDATGRSSLRGLAWAADTMQEKIGEALDELLSDEKSGTGDEG